MQRSAPVDGFRLAYRRRSPGPSAGPAPAPAAVLLHGWPGDHADYDAVLPLLEQGIDVVVPDLRGFGESDRHPADPAAHYSAAAQARSVMGLVDELGLDRPVIAGYDVGSRVAQAAAAARPDRVRAIVISPPVPGFGERVLGPDAQAQFWYQAFHQLQLAERLLDGARDPVREYLRHFWSAWSGPAYEPPAAALDRLADLYSRPGAFTASIAWYRAGAGTVARSLQETAPSPEGRLAVETTVLWPEHDPLFPAAWADRLDAYFSRVTLLPVPGSGHFIPVEAPEALARAINASAGAPS